MVLEDFTTYIEVEPDDRIQKTATHVDAELRRNEDSYLYKDKGVGHFTDFEHKVDVKLISGSAHGAWGLVWGLTKNIVDDVSQWQWATDMDVHFFREIGTYQISLEAALGEDKYTCALNTWYYLTIKKLGTALTCKIYSDSARTNLLACLFRTIADDLYRYIYACATVNTGHTMVAVVDVENLDLQEALDRFQEEGPDFRETKFGASWAMLPWNKRFPKLNPLVRI